MNETTFHLAAANSKPTLHGLRDVQEFVTETRMLCRKGEKHFPAIEFGVSDSLPGAIETLSGSPNNGIVLALGYATGEIREAMSQRAANSHISVLSSPPKGTESYHRATSSLFEHRAITRLESLREGARKELLRFAAKGLGELREIVAPSEFESYFALRYRVWKEMGYLSPEKGLEKDKWEIDYFDRFSRPIGLFSRDHELLACARLVYEYGMENPPSVRTITRLLNRHRLNNAKSAFALPGIAEQPFDVLCEFRAFREYFHSFVLGRLAVAEVSRVIVVPTMRGRGLAEVLVDSLTSLAAQKGIDVLMLACRESLAPFYGRCGFTPVANLVSDKFIAIPEKSIVMERKL
ncbi:MAG: GNAT family N-acetyltransferase [Methylococcales bacterium]